MSASQDLKVNWASVPTRTITAGGVEFAYRELGTNTGTPVVSRSPGASHSRLGLLRHRTLQERATSCASIHACNPARSRLPDATWRIACSASSTVASMRRPLSRRNETMAACPTLLLPSRNGWFWIREKPSAAALPANPGSRSSPPKVVAAAQLPIPTRQGREAAPAGDSVP